MVLMLSVFVLSVTIKHIILSVIMLIVVILSVIMLSVSAPKMFLILMDFLKDKSSDTLHIWRLYCLGFLSAKTTFVCTYFYLGQQQNVSVLIKIF
jgi:hypothetical protein